MESPAAHPAATGPDDPGLPTHGDDGVDLTLIRWFLTLTPAERLQFLQDNVSSILRLRGDDTEA